MRLFFRLLVAILLCVGASQVFAQSGGLQVRVLDARDGSPLPGATVTLSNDQGLIAPSSEVADDDGLVRFPVLRTGPGYIVEVVMPGFASQRLVDQRVSSNMTGKIDIGLTETVEETIQVVARRDVVELEETGGSNKFDEIFIDNMPVPGRFYQNMLTLAPGVVDADHDGNPNVHGSRERDFKALVGGVSNVDPLTGQWLSRINPESIEEMEILPWGAGVEFGRASGGFARILQKQGSNEFEGVVSLIYGSSSLDKSSDNVPNEMQPEYEWFQPAFQLSGPFVRDKLWFRLSHERIKSEDPIDLIGDVVVGERDQKINADQITWQVSPRNKLAFQYQSDPLEVTNYGVSSRVPPESARTLKRGGDTYSITWTAPQSARLLVESQVAYQDHYTKLLPQSEEVEYNGCAIFGWHWLSDIESLNGVHCFNTDTGREGGPYPETSEDRRQRFTFRTQSTNYISNFLGAGHQLKLGLVVENERYFRSLDRRPDLTFYTEPTPFGPYEAIGFSVARVAAPAVSEAKSTGVAWGLYAEDQIKPLQNLVVTVGLRFDREEIDSPGHQPFDPSAESDYYLSLIEQNRPIVSAMSKSFTSFGQVYEFREDLAVVLETEPNNLPLGPTAVASTFWPKTWRTDDINISRNNLSPRIAVAWDPWSNGKTRFSLSAGRYYDKIVLAVPLVEVEPPETFLTFVSIPFFRNGVYFDIGRRGAFQPHLNVQMVDRNLKTPYQDEFAFKFERELWPETSVRLTYLHRDFEDQLQDIDINHSPGDMGRCVLAPSFGNAVVVSSPGEGMTVIDPHTGEEYLDADPGNGDGRIDDCTGSVINIGGPVLGFDLEQPDGLSDLYQLNPGWGEILLVGNFNTTEYDAVVLEFVRRMYRSWEMNFSYTWSEAIGNAEDFDQILGNERTLSDDEYGFLSFDQRNVVKLSAVGLAGWGMRLGGTIRWESGLPFSVLVSRPTVYGRPPEYGNLVDMDQEFRFRYPTRQRNDERNPTYWTIDAKVAKDFAISKAVTGQVSVEVFNLLDDDTIALEDRINGVNTGIRRFGRQWQLGMRVAF